MSDKLFLLKNDASLIEMKEGAFPSEDVFQSLLERFPALLTDGEFGAETPRRWILVKREAGISDRKDGGNRWSLDHLFLDQDGVPTLVEIKRATDSRARREVVAQMLDYAANSIQWWKVGDLQKWFIESCLSSQKDHQEQLATLTQTESVDPEAFWSSVQSNLSSGRIRMIIVADKLAPELERIVEFLNEQMSPAIILALELRPFSSGEDRILSPRIVGATARAAAQKSVSNKPAFDSVDDWFEGLALDQPKISQLKKVANIARSAGARLVLAGQSAAVEFSTVIGPCNIIYLRPYGLVALSGWMLRKIPQFEAEAARVEAFESFDKAGFPVSNKFANGEPNITLPKLDDDAGWDRLQQHIQYFADQLKGR